MIAHAGTAADFITKITPVSAGIGGEAEFTAQVDGSPMPTVRWFRDGVELKPGGRVRVTQPDESNGGFAKLLLTDLHENDTGDITCEIASPAGKQSCSADLEVFGEFLCLSNQLCWPICNGTFCQTSSTV